MPDLFGTKGPTRGSVADSLCWPADLSPALSDIWAGSERFINAAPSMVFTRLISANCWEQYFANISDVHINEPGRGCLEAGCEFDFEIDGLRLFARITEFLPGRRLAWSGQGIDITVYQAWKISGDLGTSRVLAGFAARGAAAIAIREMGLGAAQTAIDRWLADLKAAAERAES